MAVLWEIDPQSEDAANTPLVLTDSTYRLLEMDLTPPEVEAAYATSADTEGDPYVGSRHRNRVVALKLMAKATTDALLETAIYNVQRKVSKLRREQGTLKFTTQTGDPLVADVLFAQFRPEFTPEYYVLNKALVFTVEFTCKPYFRGASTLLSDHAETTLPYLTFTETSLAGDVPGLGRLVVDNDDATNNQNWLIWGLETNALYDTTAATAALFYEAEGRTPLGGSATAAGPTGASGAGSNVVQNTGLTQSYLALMSTQASGGGAHLSHVGTFRVFVRVQTPTSNTGQVSVCLEWAVGDFYDTTRNDAVAIPVDNWGGTWRLLDLGYVRIPKVVQGTQRWEGRILGKSTVSGDDINIDYLLMIPVDAGSGEISSSGETPGPSSYSIRDEFDQTSGALTGKVAPQGGTWTFLSGDTDDYSVNATNHWVTRSTTSDTARRIVYTGTASLTDMVAQMDCWAASRGASEAVFHYLAFRIVDANNFGFIQWSGNQTSSGFLAIVKVVAGATTVIASKSGVSVPIPAETWRTLRLKAAANGQVDVWLFAQGTSPSSSPDLKATDTVFATAGTLASGKVGIGDTSTLATAYERRYDNILAWVPGTPDAVIYASQSLEIRHDQLIREDSGGNIWTQKSIEGDYLKVLPGGMEGRLTRFILKTSRNAPPDGADSGIDDLSARLTYTPRHLVLPT
jgi:hypothetical protein